ncbi:MAG: hypothetical protein WD960_13145 [Gemmatimonadota bacterium]
MKSRNDWTALRGKYFQHVIVLAAAGALLAGCSEENGAEEDGVAAAAPAATQERAADGEGTARSQGTAAPAVVGVPSGATLIFEVAEEVSTSQHRTGDTFALRLSSPVQGTGGFVLPAGTEARGVVTASAESSGPEDEAVLAIRVQSVELNGRTRALQGQVTHADVESGTRDSGTRTAAKVATGAAAGAVIGQILGGNTRSTVQGAAAGTAAGVGVALTTRDGHATLPQGSLVTVRLDDSLVVD